MKKEITVKPTTVAMLEVGIKNLPDSSLLVRSPIVRTDEAPEVLCSLYEIAGKKNTYGIPAGWFKRAMVRWAKGKSCEEISGSDVLRNIWVMPDHKAISGLDLVTIKGSRPHQVQDVWLPFGHCTPRIITFTEINIWKSMLQVRFNSDAFTAEEVLNLINLGGSDDGCGRKRIGEGYNHGGYSVSEKPAPKVTYFKSSKGVV